MDGSSQAGILVRSTCLALDDMLFDRLGSLWKRYHDEIDDLIEGTSRLETNRQPQHSIEPLPLPCVDMDITGLTESIHNLYLNDSPESHFLAFLHCLSEGERVGALHSLHQFVDTAMIAERKKEYDTSKKRGNVLGHAAVLLASVHAKFGEGALHKLATDEALRVAQQSGDTASFAFAMGLLYESNSGGAPQDVLQQCTTRAASARPRSKSKAARKISPSAVRSRICSSRCSQRWREVGPALTGCGSRWFQQPRSLPLLVQNEVCGNRQYNRQNQIAVCTPPCIADAVMLEKFLTKKVAHDLQARRQDAAAQGQ